MLGVETKIIDETKKVKEAVEKASFRNLGHAAASIRKEAAASISKGQGASAVGSPPHTRRGQLKKSILYAFDYEEAIIGPAANLIGTAGQPHEFGGEYKGEEFPARPFMGPALVKNLDRFASDWENSVI